MRGDLERRLDRIVLEVDQHGDVHFLVVVLGELGRCPDGVPAVGGDQAVRDRAHAAAAPPRGLGVGGDTDRSGHVRGPAVPGLDEPVVVAGGEEEDLLTVAPRGPPR